MKNLLSSFCLALLFSCQQTPSPKETAQIFISSLAAADFTTASSLVSRETKALLSNPPAAVKPVTSPEETFQLNNLSESIQGQTADVKNNRLSLSMVREEDGWKVVLDEALLNAVLQHEEWLSAVKIKWAALQSEYEGRLRLARAYVDYKKSAGAYSEKLLALTETVYNFQADSIRTKEELLAYIQRQQQLGKAIDAAVEPSVAANADLSLQYIVQLSTAADRIKAAEAAYQAAAQKALSPLFVPLPFGAAAEPRNE